MKRSAVGLSLALSVCTSGCALIGSGIGALSADDAPPPKRLQPDGFTAAEFESRYRLEVGDEIVLLLHSGRRYHGVYLGVRLQTDSSSPFVVRLRTRGARSARGRLAPPSLPQQLPRPPDEILSIRSGAIAEVQYNQPTAVAVFVLGGIGLVFDVLVVGASLALAAALP